MQSDKNQYFIFINIYNELYKLTSIPTSSPFIQPFSITAFQHLQPLIIFCSQGCNDVEKMHHIRQKVDYSDLSEYSEQTLENRLLQTMPFFILIIINPLPFYFFFLKFYTVVLPSHINFSLIPFHAFKHKYIDITFF